MPPAIYALLPQVGKVGDQLSDDLAGLDKRAGFQWSSGINPPRQSTKTGGEESSVGHAVSQTGEAVPLFTSLEQEQASVDPEEEVQPVNKWALRCLLLQHASSTFTAGSYEFAAFLFLIEVFKDTLVPASLVGLATKLAGLLLSGYMGGLVDRYPRLPLVRATIGAEKVFKGINYGLFLRELPTPSSGPLLMVSANQAFHGVGPVSQIIATWTILLLTIACSTLLGLANTTLEVAIERDWVMTIARSRSETLTLLNTSMRRIDLLSKLLSPLFVSVLTTTVGYFNTASILLAWVAVTAIAEYTWIQVVYNRFPILDETQSRPANPEDISGDLEAWRGGSTRQRGSRGLSGWIKREMADWSEFARLPIFCSSIAIAAIYLTTLSYDGAFMAYIKAARGYDDGFVAAMRGICVLTGLLGTFLMPRLERLIGLERAGAWSIWFEVVCLAPAVLAFFYGTGAYGTKGAVWNEVLLFGGIAASRIGLWSFDLCQLKELQQALDDHPNRNRLTALQISLQNTFDLLKYALTLAASTPHDFKWTALVSWLAVAGGAASYAVFLRRVRGHLVHFEWFRKGR